MNIAIIAISFNRLVSVFKLTFCGAKGHGMLSNRLSLHCIPVKYVTLASEYEKEPTYEELMKDAQPAVITMLV